MKKRRILLTVLGLALIGGAGAYAALHPGKIARQWAQF